jgi:hypothetical protein
MAENGNKANNDTFHRVKEHLRHGAHRMTHFRQPVEAPPANVNAPGAVDPHLAPPRIPQEHPGSVDGVANTVSFEDLPYDPSREDAFSSEVILSSLHLVGAFKSLFSFSSYPF